MEKPTGPWYRNYNYWNELAHQYLSTYKNLPTDAPHHYEIQNACQVLSYELIFESNLIENEGLSKGETRKVIEQFFPKIEDIYSPWDGVHLTDSIVEQLDQQAVQTINGHKLNRDIVKPSVTFAGKSKGVREVAQHYNAYLLAMNYVSMFKHEETKTYQVAQILQNDPPDWDYWVDIWRNLSGQNTFPDQIERPKLLTEERIKYLHETIADGLLDTGNPGEYRQHAVSVGWQDVIFPAPELVPASMAQFVEKAADIFYAGLENQDYFTAAAKISYEFVRIHPFPDFNGRLSRLILVMVLFAYSVPFPITLRGDKKGRKRYFSSLQKANIGDFKPYAALIAMRVAETFRQLDYNLERAGLPLLLSFGDA